MEYILKLRRIINIMIVAIPMLIIIIITNGVVSQGHLIEYDDFVTPSSTPSYSGYDMESGHFTLVDGEDPYVTFYHYAVCPQFVIFFNDPAEEDVEIPVWLKSNDGEVYRETTVVWEKGSRVLSIDVDDERVMLVSLSIDRDFSVYHLMSVMPYYTYRWKAFCFIFLTTVLLIVYGILYRLGVLRKLTDRWAAHLAHRLSFMQEHHEYAVSQLIIKLVLIVGSVGLALLVTYIISHIGVRINSQLVRFNASTVAFLSLVIAYVGFVLVYRRRIAKRFPIFAFWSVMIAGLTCMIAQSGCVGLCWDDQIHYGDAVYLSHLFDARQHITEWFMEMAGAWYPWSRSEASELYAWFNELYKGDYFYTLQHYTFKPVKLVYLPNAVGFMLGRGLKLPMQWVVYLGRFCNLLFMAVMTYFGSRRLKYGRLVLLMIVLLPTNIFLSSNIAYDGWVTGWSLLGFACLFGELQRPKRKMSTWTMILIPLCFLLAPLHKQVYFVMTIPAFFVSSKKFRTKARKWIYRGLVALAMLTPFILVFISHIINVDEGDVRGESGSNSIYQLEYIKHNFGAFLRTLVNFLRYYLEPYTLSKWNSPIDSYAYAGGIGLGTVIITLIIIAALLSHEERRGDFPWWYRLGMLVIYAGTGAICATAMYISFTAVGSSGIGGCQGRYIIPMYFPTLYVLTRIPVRTYIRDFVGRHNVDALFGGVMVLINCWCVWNLMLVYY